MFSSFSGDEDDCDFPVPSDPSSLSDSASSPVEDSPFPESSYYFSPLPPPNPSPSHGSPHPSFIPSSNSFHLIEDCPRDCLTEILTFVPFRDLYLNVALACRDFHEISRSERCCSDALRFWLYESLVVAGGGCLFSWATNTRIFATDLLQRVNLDQDEEEGEKEGGEDENPYVKLQRYIHDIRSGSVNFLQPIFDSDYNSSLSNLSEFAFEEGFLEDMRKLVALIDGYGNHNGAVQFSVFRPSSSLFDPEAAQSRKSVPLMLHKIAAIRSLVAFPVAKHNPYYSPGDNVIEDPFQFALDSPLSDCNLLQILLHRNHSLLVRGGKYCLCCQGYVPTQQSVGQLHLENFQDESPLNGHLRSTLRSFTITWGAVRNPPTILHPMDFISQACHPPYGTTPGIEESEEELNEMLFDNFRESKQNLPDMWVWAASDLLGSQSDENKAYWCESFKYGDEWFGYVSATYYLPKWNVIVAIVANETD